MNTHILILEDDPLFSETLGDVIEGLGYSPVYALDSETALELTFHRKFSLYLLDVKVPGINGFDFLDELRKSGDETPAMFITSLRDKESLSKGFKSGCDDFLRKPVDIEELELRTLALLKRSGAGKEGIIVDGTEFLPAEHTLVRGEETIILKPQESRLLQLLLQNRGKVVEKSRIFDILWDGEPNEGALRVYINALKKLYGKEKIVNIRGVGYRFE